MSALAWRFVHDTRDHSEDDITMRPHRLALAALLLAVPLSAQTIRVTTPPGAAGPADVVVTNPDGQADTLFVGFTYIAPAPSIASVSPVSGPVAGGTEIIVVGADFEPGAVVTVGGVVASVVGAPDPGVWPDNEPSGLVPVFPGHPTVPGVLLDGSDVKFDYTSQGGSDIGSSFFFGTKWDGTIVEKTTSPGSRYANIIRKNMFIGDNSDWHGIASDDQFAADYEILYIRIIFRFSDNWQFNGAGEKLFYFGEGDVANGNDFYVSMQRISGEEHLSFTNQGGGGVDNGEWRSTTNVTRGEWHTIELIVNAQSAVGVSDGSFQVFLDDVEVTGFVWLGGGEDPGQNAIEFYGSGDPTRLFSGMQFPLYWGGQASVKTVNDHVDISELYITGKVAAS